MFVDAIGLDIGGANLKAATADGHAVCRPFELWKRPQDLAHAIGQLIAEFPRPRTVAITMTGELCDCFATKREGVHQILDAIAANSGKSRLLVWSTAGSFMSIDESRKATMEVASANWHALATFAGRFVPDGPALLVDTGTTTTDVIPLSDGLPIPIGITDTERLRSRELVYTGATRTPVCALLGPAVAAELFATTLDAYLFLGMIPESPGNTATADGRPATLSCAHARLSRMIGGDAESTGEGESSSLAGEVFARQRSLIADAMSEVAARMDSSPQTILVSGSGEFLARAATAEFAKITPVRTASLAATIGHDATEAACAYALAVLATELRD